MKKFLLFLFVMYTQHVMADEYNELVAYRDALKEQIGVIDSEITRCEKSLRGWKIATILGGVGTVASGIGIIAQNQQIKENSKILNETSATTKEADDVIKFIKKVNE